MIRNNNPCNIRNTKTKWHGETTIDEEFESFSSPEMGLRAAMKIINTYYYKYGMHTIRQIISRWAPPSENDTPVYQAYVSEQMGIGIDDFIDMNKENMIKLIKPMTIMENGHPKHSKQWYDDSTFEKAYDLL